MPLTSYILAGGAILAALAAIQKICALIDARKFPPPGRIVSIPNGRMHVKQMGEGSPAIVLEAGIAASTLNWSLLQPELALHAATYSYDRAGFGWSTARDGACSLPDIANNLRATITALDLPRPYILVGHSFAGLILREYALRFPDEIAGIVLIDPLTPEEWLTPSRAQRWMLRRGIWFSRAGGVLAAFGVVRVSLWLLQRGNRSTPRGILKLFGAKATETVQRILRELTKLPPDVMRIIRARWSTPRFFWTMSDYIQSLPRCSAEMIGRNIPPNIPVTVLSGAHQLPQRLREHAAIAAHSRNGRQIIAQKGAHWIHLDQPELVVQAVLEMGQAMKFKI
ncbi:MAG TPA: alpha/beta hydrolase [Candidatus Angelobacter sp.]|nr:alpha/beta hydrolase [Candidatus Angelobacter sp.]